MFQNCLLLLVPLVWISAPYFTRSVHTHWISCCFFSLFSTSCYSPRFYVPCPRVKVHLLSATVSQTKLFCSHFSKQGKEGRTFQMVFASIHTEFIFSDPGWSKLSCHNPDKRTLGLCIMALISPHLYGEFFALYILGYHLTFSWTKLIGDSQSTFDQLVHPDVSPLVTFAEDVFPASTHVPVNYGITRQALTLAIEIIPILLCAIPACFSETFPPSSQSANAWSQLKNCNPRSFMNKSSKIHSSSSFIVSYLTLKH